MSPEEAYAQALPLQGLRPKTVRAASDAVADFRRWRGDLDIDGPLLMAWREELAGRKITRNYANLLMAHVRGMLKWAIRAEQLAMEEQTVAVLLRAFRVDVDEPRILTRAEISRLAQACTVHICGRAVLWLLCTGMRREEAARIRPEHLGEAGVTVPAANSKNHTGRTIPRHLLGTAASLLDPLPLHLYEGGWRWIRKAAEIDVPIKALRSTWVTYALSRGILTPWQVCKLAGHTLGVSEAKYQGAPLFGLTGDTMPEWMGVAAAIDTLQQRKAKLQTALQTT